MTPTLAQRCQALREAGVHSLLVQFADIHGTAKGKLVPLTHLEAVVNEGAGFAGPSIWGTGLPRTGPRAEYWARGDISTLQILPWMPGVARIVGDGYVAGEPFGACPRQVLRRALTRLQSQGLQMQAGIEPEFFLLRRQGEAWAPADAQDTLDKPSYDLKALGRQSGFLHDLHHALAACGLNVLQLDHEDANGQYEVNFAHDAALASADHLMLFKLAAHALAEKHGMVFSMMPKPFADQPGSGLHWHVSLWSGQVNVFAAQGEPQRAEDAAAPLSTLGQHFLAGVLAHAPALCAIGAPTINSYKRLAAGGSRSGTHWAPAVIAHGPNNRTTVARTLPGRLEWRLPDASANPYLVAASMVAAGLDGMARALPLPAACTLDLQDATPQSLRESGCQTLPRNLDEALDALACDAVILDALGSELSETFLALKRAEAQDYARQVSAWEWARYATAF